MLFLSLKEAEGHLADERGPAGIGTEGPNYPVAYTKSVEVENDSRWFFAETAAVASLK